MTLHYIMTFGVIASVIAFALLMSILAVRAIYTVKSDDIAKSIAVFDNTTITIANAELKKKQKQCEKLKTLSQILLYVSMAIMASSLCAIFIFCWYKHVAIQHGAFGDFTKTETIQSIGDRSKHMFKDDSEQLPDDLSGSILIFFKFTCNDCYDTHDQIMALLEQEQVTNVHFISTASNKGAELISRFEVKAVPWGVYVDENGETEITDILYDEFEQEPEKKFIKENLMKLIQAQKGEPIE